MRGNNEDYSGYRNRRSCSLEQTEGSHGSRNEEGSHSGSDGGIARVTATASGGGGRGGRGRAARGAARRGGGGIRNHGALGVQDGVIDEVARGADGVDDTRQREDLGSSDTTSDVGIDGGGEDGRVDNDVIDTLLAEADGSVHLELGLDNTIVLDGEHVGDGEVLDADGNAGTNDDLEDKLELAHGALEGVLDSGEDAGGLGGDGLGAHSVAKNGGDELHGEDVLLIRNGNGDILVTIDLSHTRDGIEGEGAEVDGGDVLVTLVHLVVIVGIDELDNLGQTQTNVDVAIGGSLVVANNDTAELDGVALDLDEDTVGEVAGERSTLEGDLSASLVASDGVNNGNLDGVVTAVSGARRRTGIDGTITRLAGINHGLTSRVVALRSNGVKRAVALNVLLLSDGLVAMTGIRGRSVITALLRGGDAHAASIEAVNAEALDSAVGIGEISARTSHVLSGALGQRRVGNARRHALALGSVRHTDAKAARISRNLAALVGEDSRRGDLAGRVLGPSSAIRAKGARDAAAGRESLFLASAVLGGERARGRAGRIAETAALSGRKRVVRADAVSASGGEDQTERALTTSGTTTGSDIRTIGASALKGGAATDSWDRARANLANHGLASVSDGDVGVSGIGVTGLRALGANEAATIGATARAVVDIEASRSRAADSGVKLGVSADASAIGTDPDASIVDRDSTIGAGG